MGLDGLSKLMVWQKAKAFAKRIYREVLPVLPAEEKWAMSQQLRRAVVSVSANLAEGHGRYYYQDNVRFCYIARGSLEETLSYLDFCQEMEFISTTLSKSLIADGEEISRMLNGYIAHVKASKQGENEPGANHKIREDDQPYITDDLPAEL
jgi:four helix bundle protein